MRDISLPPEVAQHRLLSRKQVAELIGMSTAQMDRLINSGRFPPPILIGARKGAWRTCTVLDFIERAEAARV